MRVPIPDGERIFVTCARRGAEECDSVVEEEKKRYCTKLRLAGDKLRLLMAFEPRPAVARRKTGTGLGIDVTPFVAAVELRDP